MLLTGQINTFETILHFEAKRQNSEPDLDSDPCEKSGGLKTLRIPNTGSRYRNRHSRTRCKYKNNISFRLCYASQLLGSYNLFLRLSRLKVRRTPACQGLHTAWTYLPAGLPSLFAGHIFPSIWAIFWLSPLVGGGAVNSE
jgi:hypothetical protein